MKKLLVSGALALSLLLPPYTLSGQTNSPTNSQQLESIVIKDGKYDNHNAFVDESKYSLEEILESIEMIVCETEYRLQYTDNQGTVVSENIKTKMLGTGIVIEKRDGKAYIITNYHVTDSAYSKEGVICTELSRRVYVFKSDGFRKEIDAKKVAYDKNLDLAILEVKDSKDFKKFPYKIGNSDELSPGDFVWIAGNPHGLEDYVLKGNVSKTKYPGQADYFMIGCDVQPGYSGGAVIAIRDGEYELVGIVVATLIRPGSENDYTTDSIGGYGIAIKINPAMKVVNNYLSQKK